MLKEAVLVTVGGRLYRRRELGLAQGRHETALSPDLYKGVNGDKW